MILNCRLVWNFAARIAGVFVLSSVGGFLGGPVRASGPVSVVAYTIPAALRADGLGKLVVQLAIHAGFHVNSAQPREANLIPTRLVLSGSPGLTLGKIVYPVASLITVGTGKVAVYQGSSVITVPVFVARGAKNGKLSGVLTYQACNASSCFPPQTLKLSVPVTVK